MEHTEWFEHWFGSPYYKILYQNRDDNEAQAFVSNLLRYLQPPEGCSMLDIGCGEGRFAIQLAGNGYDVTGIDLSAISIERAKEFENDHLHFFLHDMRFPFYINYFDYTFNFFTSFGYFAHDRDHMMAAKAFAASVKKGGTLVIDYLNRDYVLAGMHPTGTVQREKYTFNIKKRFERNHIIKDINFLDPEGKEHNCMESVAAFSLQDFEVMFQKAGLTLTATFGNYKLDAYHSANSPRMIMVFKK
ncbi:MAG: methyltransferase domain-containing protein [Taibaiella sp.]|nr:methyltransferase domain-containing protein [Taibaiella sp.]